MNLAELYKQTPRERHQEIVVSGNRLFFDGEEYVIGGDGELRLIRSDKDVRQRIEAILAGVVALKSKLGIS